MTKIVFESDGTARHLLEEDQDVVEAIGEATEVWRNSHVETVDSLSQEAIDELAKWLPGKKETPEQRRELIAAQVTPLDWFADMLPVNGPVLGPFKTREEALAKEVEYLEENGLPLPRRKDDNSTGIAGPGGGTGGTESG